MKFFSGKIYEFWYIGKNGFMVVGIFDVDGFKIMSVVFIGKMNVGDIIGVIIEFVGGLVKLISNLIVVVIMV